VGAGGWRRSVGWAFLVAARVEDVVGGHGRVSC
jgi:hypothetical protein